jgi:cytoskeletal protein RodZ
MAKYLDNSDNYLERRNEPEVRLSATEARQGRLGRPVLTVLVASLVLVILAWAAAELWGMYIAPRDEAVDHTTTSSTTSAPAEGKNVIDDNPPASGKIEPAPTIQDSNKM